ncbi:hypothetical protein ACNQ13_01345 [Mycoplasma sp. VS428]|uniref:hypothetical protein n=1 Tax=Mycoplasma sp. VS428 TaxID=3401684 RepID=UPI003AAF0749
MNSLKTQIKLRRLSKKLKTTTGKEQMEAALELDYLAGDWRIPKIEDIYED